MAQETNLNSIYIIISCVTLAAAILCPVLTAWINNWYQLKLKKLELSDSAARLQLQHDRDIIENYLKNAGACIQNSTYENLAAYNSYYSLAFQCIPEELHVQMRILNNNIVDLDVETASSEYEKLAIMLRKHKDKSSKD